MFEIFLMSILRNGLTQVTQLCKDAHASPSLFIFRNNWSLIFLLKLNLRCNNLIFKYCFFLFFLIFYLKSKRIRYQIFKKFTFFPYLLCFLKIVFLNDLLFYPLILQIFFLLKIKALFKVWND